MNLRSKLYSFFWLLLTLFISGSGTYSLYAQNTEFEKLFEEAAEQQYNNPQKSLDLYKYLLKTNLKEESQFSVYLEQLHTYQILGQYSNAVEVKQVLDNKIDNINDKELLFRYWLETTILYNSLDFAKETQNSIEKLEDRFNAMSVAQKDKYQNHLDYIRISFKTPTEEFDKLASLKTIQSEWTGDVARNTWLSFKLAELYFEKDKDSSLFYLDKVLETQNHLLNPLADVYIDWIKNETIDSTVVSLQVLENESLQYEIKINFLNRLIAFWKSNTEPLRVVQYTEILDAIKQENVLEKRQAKTLLLENVYYAKQDLAILKAEKERRQQLLILIALFFCLVVYVASKFYLKKKKSAKENILIEKEAAKSKLIPSKTEQEILKRLEAFEDSTLFLDKQLRIATLAKHLETNTRYLSLILNEKKNKSFNNYINQLRIKYIINKLDKEPIYLSYKISYLAEESGFASQSSFSTSFKEVTGKSPSAYIKHISDNRSI